MPPQPFTTCVGTSASRWLAADCCTAATIGSTFTGLPTGPAVPTRPVPTNPVPAHPRPGGAAVVGSPVVGSPSGSSHTKRPRRCRSIPQTGDLESSAITGRRPQALTCSASCWREAARVRAILAGSKADGYRTLAEYQARRRTVQTPLVGRTIRCAPFGAPGVRGEGHRGRRDPRRSLDRGWLSSRTCPGGCMSSCARPAGRSVDRPHPTTNNYGFSPGRQGVGSWLHLSGALNLAGTSPKGRVPTFMQGPGGLRWAVPNKWGRATCDRRPRGTERSRSRRVGNATNAASVASSSEQSPRSLQPRRTR